MQAEGADFTGWGSKQGSKMKTWKKRFFVLRGRELVYYSGSEEKGRITVAGADFAPELKNGLLVRGEKQRKSQVLKMKTATADESKAWLLKLRQAVANADTTNDHISASFRTRSASSSAISSTHNSFMAPSLPSVPERHHRSDAHAPPSGVMPSFRSRANTASNEKRGWLLKEGSKVKSWKKRYFVLRNNVLTYYADEQSSPKLGAVVVRSVETNFTTPFTLDVQADSGRVLRIAADSLVDIEGWDLAITEAIARGDSGGTDVARRASDNQSSESAARLALAASSISTASSTSYNDDVFEQHGKVQYRLAHQPSALLGESFREQKHQQQQQLAAIASNNTTCEGWLLKQGQQSKTWKRRYFTLTNASIEYRHDPNDVPNEEEGVVDIVYETTPGGVVAHVDLDSGRTITITGESQQEFERWAEALSELTGSKVYQRLEKQGSSSANTFGREERVMGPSVVPAKQEAVELSGPPASPEVKYGWLLKQGHLIRSWKRRYFVLEGDSLQYFEHIDKPARGGGAVARVVRDPATVGDNCLDIHLTNGRILKVASEDQGELESWHDALLNASRLLPTLPTDAERPSGGNTVDDADVLAKRLTKKLKQEGWLLKKGQNFKTWKMRFFVLERSRLLYYAGDDDAERSEVLGSGVVFEAAVGDFRPFCIDVRFQNGRLLQVVAPDEEQFSLWLDALQNASNLTESFLSQHEDSQRSGGEAATFDDEFDLDFADDGAADEDLDWSSSNQHDESERDTKSGFSTWSAAMTNKPEFERASSWSSSEDDTSDAKRSSDRMVGDDTVSPPRSPVNAQPAVVAGWLNKEGGAIKTWKRRYFSLHGPTLRYFKSESGSLLRVFTVVGAAESLSLPLGLEVETTTDRTLVLTAESKSEYAKWFTALQSAASTTVESANNTSTMEPIFAAVRSPVHGSANVSAPSRPSAVGTSAPASPAAMADAGLVSTVNAEGKTVVAFNGWLEKEGERIKTWKRRYFTYKKGALLYYREIGGVALGHGIVTGVRVDESKAFTLSVQLENDRSMRVSAESQDDMDTWLRVLSSNSPVPTAAAAGASSWSSRGSETRDSVAGTKQETLQNGVVAAAGVGGRGDARERLDPNDYLSNDTISNESFLRIQGGPQRQHGESVPGSFVVESRRSFKGDLSFGDEDEEKEEDEEKKQQTQKQALMAAESAEDLAYYRTLLVESELERERREAEKAGNVSGCAPCCVVM